MDANSCSGTAYRIGARLGRVCGNSRTLSTTSSSALGPLAHQDGDRAMTGFAAEPRALAPHHPSLRADRAALPIAVFAACQLRLRQSANQAACLLAAPRDAPHPDDARAVTHYPRWLVQVPKIDPKNLRPTGEYRHDSRPPCGWSSRCSASVTRIDERPMRCAACLHCAALATYRVHRLEAQFDMRLLSVAVALVRSVP